MQLPTNPWQFHLLGGVKIMHQGERLPTPPQRTLELLATILFNPRPQPRLYVASLLSPDLPESGALRKLSDLLWLLRRALPDLPLEATREYIYLPPDQRWLDAETFACVEQSRDLGVWIEALTLYQGELLPGVYAEWLMLERERLHLTWVQLLNRVIKDYIERQEFQNALPWLQRLTQAEPMDEAAVRTSMKIYAALGQRGEALAIYERFRHYAANELNIYPEMVTQTLAESLYTPHYDAASTDEKIGEETSPESLVRQGYQALQRGDLSALKQRLTLLSKIPSARGSLEPTLLEADYALSVENTTLAAEIIERLDSTLLPVQLRMAKLTLQHENLSQARQTASQALLVAHEKEDAATELEVLLILAQVQCRQGEMGLASISLDKAVQLAWRLETPHLLGRAWLEQAWVFIRQGRYGDALTLLHQATSLAEQHGLKGILAEILTSKGLTQVYKGNFTEARETIIKALSLWRDLSAAKQEAKCLQRLALICNQVGDNEQALYYLEQAQKIFIEAGDELGVARNQYNLAAALPYKDESLTTRSISLAKEALETFRKHRQVDWEASTLETLGYNLWVAGEHEQATGYLEEAYRLHEKLGEAAVLPEILAYQALARLGMGHVDEALDASQKALLALAQGTLDNDIVSEVYYAQAMVLEALGNAAGAQDYLQKAYQNLLKYAGQFEDEASRQAFFRRDPTVRRLMNEVRKRQIVPSPEGGIIQGWATSQSGRRAPASWTLDAGPPDVALKQSKGAAALRRARLGRILRESAAQKVSLTQAQLGNLLGVSTRTIKRDLTLLRQENP